MAHQVGDIFVLCCFGGSGCLIALAYAQIVWFLLTKR